MSATFTSEKLHEIYETLISAYPSKHGLFVDDTYIEGTCSQVLPVEGEENAFLAMFYLHYDQMTSRKIIHVGLRFEADPDTLQRGNSDFGPDEILSHRLRDQTFTQLIANREVRGHKTPISIDDISFRPVKKMYVVTYDDDSEYHKKYKFLNKERAESFYVEHSADSYFNPPVEKDYDGDFITQ